MGPSGSNLGSHPGHVMHFCFAATAVSMRIHFLSDSIFHGEELKVTAEMGEKEKRGVRSSLKLAKRGESAEF